MPKKKRTKGQIEKDSVRISELFVKGLSLRKISKQLSSERAYSLDHTQIKYDLDKILKEWKSEAFENIQDKQLIEIKKLNKVESEAWIAYDETQSARFLEIILKCIEKRCRIFGIEEVPETYTERRIIVVRIPDEEEDQDEGGAQPASD